MASEQDIAKLKDDLRSKRFDLAAAACEELLTHHGANFELNVLSGKANFELGNFGKARNLSCALHLPVSVVCLGAEADVGRRGVPLP
jgi:hypothetical protein